MASRQETAKALRAALIEKYDFIPTGGFISAFSEYSNKYKRYSSEQKKWIDTRTKQEWSPKYEQSLRTNIKDDTRIVTNANKPFRVSEIVNQLKIMSATSDRNQARLAKKGMFGGIFDPLIGSKTAEGGSLWKAKGQERVDKYQKRLDLAIENAKYKGPTKRQQTLLEGSVDDRLKESSKEIVEKGKQVLNAENRIKLEKDIFDPKNQTVVEAAAAFRNQNLGKFSNIIDTNEFKGHASLDGSQFQLTEMRKGGSKENNKFGTGLLNDLNFNTEQAATLSGADVKDGEVVIPKKSWKDIKGMKRGKDRDESTLKHFENQGYDFSGVSKHSPALTD